MILVPLTPRRTAALPTMIKKKALSWICSTFILPLHSAPIPPKSERCEGREEKRIWNSITPTQVTDDAHLGRSKGSQRNCSLPFPPCVARSCFPFADRRSRAPKVIPIKEWRSLFNPCIPIESSPTVQFIQTFITIPFSPLLLVHFH